MGEEPIQGLERHESANVVAARLMAQGEEEMRLARAAMESSGAETKKMYGVASDEKMRGGSVEDDLTKQIQELLVSVSPRTPSPLPTRSRCDDQTYSARDSTAKHQVLDHPDETSKQEEPSPGPALGLLE
jgi:hypothetical protein